MAGKSGRPGDGACPRMTRSFRREVVTVFVPVNDSAGPADDPFCNRHRQSHEVKKPGRFRQYGSGTRRVLCVGPMQQQQTWMPIDRHWTSCVAKSPASVIRHHWCECGWRNRPLTSRQSETWVPDDEFADWQARRVSEGTLNLLDRQFNRRGREDFDRLSDEIESQILRRRKRL